MAIESWIKKLRSDLATILAKTNIIGASVALESGGNISSIKVQTDYLAGETEVQSSTTANWQTAEANIVLVGGDDSRFKLLSLFLSLHNFVGTVTIRMYIKINGTERQIYPPAGVTWDPSQPVGLPLISSVMGIHRFLRITAQSDNATDNGKAIDYDYMLEAMYVALG